MAEPLSEIVNHLRQRIQRAVQAGVMAPGSRLPSARSLQVDLRADHRVVLAAYRQLADEGMVDMRNPAEEADSAVMTSGCFRSFMLLLRVGTR